LTLRSTYRSSETVAPVERSMAAHSQTEAGNGFYPNYAQSDLPPKLNAVSGASAPVRSAAFSLAA